MSTFAVELRKVAEVVNHPNADRLSLCKLEGLGCQIIIGRDQYKVGDEVVSFPLDGEIPLPLVEAMGMTGKFSGPLKNRVSTVKLRGVISQGYVAPVETILKYLREHVSGKPLLVSEYPDLTTALGVTKYDQEPVECKAGNLHKLPEGVPVYDIEGVDRNQQVIDYIIQNRIKVMISEKLEGTNYSCTYFADGRDFVSQRHHTIQEMREKGEHEFWRVSREKGILELVKNIQMDANAHSATVRGEMIGGTIQKNIYGIKGKELRFFDIMLTGAYVGVEDFLRYFEKFGFKDMLVPILAVDVYLDDWLAGRTVQQAAGGPSVLGFSHREGIVIKPMVEQYHSDIGRLIIKHRDAEYRLKTGL
jgi:RNA ligase (TIGR02306 family)